MTRAAERFEIAVGDDVLDDLRARLARTRRAPDFANDDWRYGFPAAALDRIVDHWLHAYDWRAQEAAMNDAGSFRTEIDGIPIHFIHREGVGPDPLPIVLTHGWPWTFWDFRQVIGPLADPVAHGGDASDAFHVVVPSLPGFGFSSPLRTPGVNFWRTADLWATLMTDVLGYERFASYGADWGAFVSAQLGHKYADRVVGVHGAGALDFWNIERPWSDAVRVTLPDEAAAREQALAWERARASHVTVHLIDPQTVAAALHDSPAGLAAYLLERRRAWSDCGGDLERRFSLDDLVTTVMIYWVTETFATSARFYFEAVANPWTPSHDREPLIQVPVGFSRFEPDMPPAGASIYRAAPSPRLADVHFSRVHARGGHFTAAEEPAAVVQDVRDMFRDLR